MAEFFHGDGAPDTTPQFLPSGFVSGGEAAFAAHPGAPDEPRVAPLPQGPPPTDPPAEPSLPPRSCRLDDGRVVTVRLTNAFHDFKMRELWNREGISIPADALGSMVLYAVCALDRISTPGIPQPTEYMLPHNRADIEGRLQQFSTGQSMILAATYMEVEGLLAAGDQFRPGEVASPR